MKIINENDENSVAIAIDFLQKNKVISFATDTVYGVAVDARKTEAVEELYKIKNRQKNKPIAIFVENIDIAKEIFEIDEFAKEVMNKFCGQPLTIVVKKRFDGKIKLAKNLNENDDFLGFRIVESEFIKKLLLEFKAPIAVTSANETAKPSAISANEVEEYFKNDDILLIDGGICKIKKPSKVIKIYDKKFEILRD